MHTGAKKSDPDQGTRQDVKRRGTDPDPLKTKDGKNADRCNGEAFELQIRSIEGSDDQYGDDVIDDGKRQQKDAHVDRDRSSEQREHAYSEGDVGRGGHGPPLATNRIGVEAEVNERGNDDATGRRD